MGLHPAPGITIVSGRNGSGKSSFAEALDSRSMASSPGMMPSSQPPQGVHAEQLGTRLR
ncbi:ATP-binding protein [Rhodococcoides fascians]|uniref:ATP-binding protein n=1 Tax=Rhodococcoides fascians TaxID=1828 RepID=UPI00352FF273